MVDEGVVIDAPPRVTSPPKRAAKLRALLVATHLPQALAMVLLMSVATAAFGGTWLSVVFVFFASAAGQATVGWTNDMHDSQADRAAGRAYKPTVRGVVQAEELRVPVLVSASLTIPLSLLAAGWIGGGAHIAAVASALVYNYWLSRTIWSWAPYAVSFALMTVFVAQAISRTLWPTLPVICLSMLVGVTAHIFNAIPDITDDRRTGWGGLAVALGRRRSIALAVVLMLVGSGLLITTIVFGWAISA